MQRSSQTRGRRIRSGAPRKLIRFSEHIRAGEPNLCPVARAPSAIVVPGGAALRQPVGSGSPQLSMRASEV